MKERKPLRSEMGWSTPDTITVRGYDLPNELLGKIDLGGMAFLEITGRHAQLRARPKCSTRCSSRWSSTA